MRSCKCVASLLCVLAAGFLLGDGAPHALRVRSYGYGKALTDDGWNVVLVQILPTEKGEKDHVVNAKVLADIHGKIKEGTTIRIISGAVALLGSAEYDVPFGDEGDIGVWPVKEIGPDKFDYDDIQGDFPFGAAPDTRIAPPDIDKVKAAFKELRSALDAPDHAAPTRARIGELLNEKNFYQWAMGAWSLARDADAADERVLKDLFGDPDLSLAQAMWLHKILMLQAVHGDTVGVLSIDEINTQLTSFLNAYVKRQPGPPNSVAPAAIPASPQNAKSPGAKP